MKKGLIHNLLFIFIISTSLTLISCNNSSKKITVSENTEGEISLEESEIIKAITTGEKLLDENNFVESKEYFNKAISLEKENKDTYLRIKDKYLSINKADEAYTIIKTAISNNVDIENMKLLLKEISSKFEVIKISSSVYQNSSYTLPKEVNINVYDTSVSIPVTWNNENVDTNSIGTFTYEGYNDEYGRKIIVDLTVMENVYDKQVGWVKNIYISNDKVYADIDLIELYLGHDEALKEAIKDGKAGIDENGEYFLPDPIWIRNNSDTIVTYPLNSDCGVYLLYPYDRSTLVNTSHDDLLKEYTKSINNERRTLLLWIESKNGSAYKITEQYLP